VQRSRLAIISEPFISIFDQDTVLFRDARSAAEPSDKRFDAGCGVNAEAKRNHRGGQ